MVGIATGAQRCVTRSVAVLVALPALLLMGGTGSCADDPPCEVAECGPPLTSPGIVCADESTGGNTHRCLRDAESGTCAWELRVCPAPVACGLSTPCPTGFYCGYEPGAMCGAAGAGVCKLTLLNVCQSLDAAVCGCNGVRARV